jgi:putative membrane protein
VWIFVLLLPFEMVEQLGVRTVPICALIGWIFISAEQVGRYTEDPFADFKHDVPMDSLCRKAEIDLLEELGEEDIPGPVQPVGGVLM